MFVTVTVSRNLFIIAFVYDSDDFVLLCPSISLSIRVSSLPLHIAIIRNSFYLLHHRKECGVSCAERWRLDIVSIIRIS